MSFDRAHIAQSVEHILGKDEVGGSIPLGGSSEVETQKKQQLTGANKNG